MKYFNVIFFSAAAVLLSGCQAFDHFRARTDFVEICDVYKNFKSDKPEDATYSAMRMSQEVSKVIDSTAAFASMQALAHADRNQKYELYLQATKEVGLKDFSCPAFEKYHTADN